MTAVRSSGAGAHRMAREVGAAREPDGFGSPSGGNRRVSSRAQARRAPCRAGCCRRQGGTNAWRGRHQASLRFFRRPPTELADGFGREAALPGPRSCPGGGIHPSTAVGPRLGPQGRLGGVRRGPPVWGTNGHVGPRQRRRARRGMPPRVRRLPG